MNSLFMAIDQYGMAVHGLVHPRKELCQQFQGRCSKMYSDGKDGKTYHVGYVIGPHWFSLFKVEPYMREET